MKPGRDLAVEDFTGFVTLLTADGDVVDESVHAVLRKSTRRGRLVEWGGMVGPHSSAADWQTARRLRIDETGVEGSVILDVQAHSDVYGAHQRAMVAGSGPPPF